MKRRIWAWGLPAVAFAGAMVAALISSTSWSAIMARSTALQGGTSVGIG